MIWPAKGEDQEGLLLEKIRYNKLIENYLWSIVNSHMDCNSESLAFENQSQSIQFIKFGFLDNNAIINNKSGYLRNVWMTEMREWSAEEHSGGTIVYADNDRTSELNTQIWDFRTTILNKTAKIIHFILIHPENAPLRNFVLTDTFRKRAGGIFKKSSANAVKCQTVQCNSAKVWYEWYVTWRKSRKTYPEMLL